MKKIHLLFHTLLVFFVLISCQEDSEYSKNLINADSKNEQHIRFASALSLALSENVGLRELIKEEALKQFDNDYDVLFNLIKDRTLEGKTVHSILSPYFESEAELLEIEEKFPLLTIFIPELPDFSAPEWNPVNEAPEVAVISKGERKVLIFSADGTTKRLTFDQIPTFPTIVVKENERVTLATNNISINGKNELTNGRFTYSFLDECFNGKLNKGSSSARRSDSFDQKVMDAYWHYVYRGLEWQRDYIYYDLRPPYSPQDPGVTRGTFKNNFSEHIRSIKLSPDALISDQAPDPTLISKKSSLSQPSWTDGAFEFRVTVLVNAVNGIGPTITKIFTLKGTDLYNVTYKKDGSNYTVDKVTSKDCPLDIELIPWNLQEYSFGWKFIFSEFDVSQSVTSSNTFAAKIATNFGFDVGFEDVVKLGFKFGSSFEGSVSQTHSITTNLESEQLGDATLTFDQPVIIGGPAFDTSTGTNMFTTREITTGNLLSISVEPKKVF